MVHDRAPVLDGMPCQAPARGGGADGAARGARRRSTATPRLRRPSSGAASPGPRAGVRLTLGLRPPNLQGCIPRHEGRITEIPEARARRSATSRHGGASRGFPSVQPNGARRRRAPGVLAHWLGVAAARRLPWSPFTSTRPRRSSHGDGGAQGHNRPRNPIRRGTAILRREGQHSGKNSSATRLHNWEANTGRNPRGRRKKKGRGAHGGATV
jgi:hypothetical protein